MAKNIGYLTASKTKESDETFTPIYAVEPLLKYLKPNSNILCPFDKAWSSFVKVLTEAGHHVSHSHKDDGQDFFNYTKEAVKGYDYIISNPPFSCKDDVLEHLYYLDRPFMMLLPLPTLQGNARGKLFMLHGLELLAFDSRIGYHTKENLEHAAKSAPFASIYFCYKALPEKLIIEKLEYKDIPLVGVEENEY